jgi:1-acyl-sn-glycerol-3-phosphate acyltransferase
VLLTVPALWLAVLVAPGARAADRAVRLWCRVILAASGCSVRLEGAEHLRGAGPAVLAANHASYLDVVVLLAALPGDFRFVAKRELLRWPLVGSVIRKVGHLTVERMRAPQSVADADRVTEALRSGISVLVFPEGTFVRSPGTLPFRLGAFKAALETGSPVIPVALLGTREVLPADAYVPQPGPLTLSVGAPFRPAGTGWPEMVHLRDETRRWIARRSGERFLERAPTAS